VRTDGARLTVQRAPNGSAPAAARHDVGVMVDIARGLALAGPRLSRPLIPLRAIMTF
jgi:hypothetical protein